LGRNAKNPKLNLNEMISFYHVARLTSVTKAARHIGVGQNTVSQHLQRLEQEYGIEVFQRPENKMTQRMNQPPTLTPKGEGLLELITPIVEGAFVLDQKMKDLKRDISYSIGTYSELVSGQLPPVIQDIQSLHPEVHLRVCSSTHETMIRQMIYGQLDLVIGIGSQDRDDDLNYEALFNFRVALLVPRGHTLSYNPFPSIEDIAEWPIIFSSAGVGVGHLAEKLLRQKRCDFQIAVDVDGVDISQQLVEKGTGVAICADFAVNGMDPSKFDVIPLNHLFDQLTVGLWTLKSNGMDELTQDIITALRRGLSDEPPTVGTAEKRALVGFEHPAPALRALVPGALAD